MPDLPGPAPQSGTQAAPSVLQEQAETLKPLLAALDNFLEATRQANKRAVTTALESKLTPMLAKAFQAQGELFLQYVQRLEGRDPAGWAADKWEPLLERAQRETRLLFSKPLKDIAGQALLAGARHSTEELGVELVSEAAPRARTRLGIRFDLLNPRAVEYLERVGAVLVTRIDETTRNFIRDLVIQAVQEGWSYDQTARRLIERYSEFAVGKPQQHMDSRAHFIAVTEVGQAYCEGNYIVGQQLLAQGLPMEKAWGTMKDDRVSDGCRENEAAGWIPFNQAFPSGHLRPLRFPGCRCDLLLRVA